MDDLRWASALEQFTLLERGEVSAAELRDAGIAACEELDPVFHFLVSTRFERAPAGVPMLLKDAGQELAGAPHYVGLSVLRDAGHRSTATTELAARFEALGWSIIGKAACPALAGDITTEPPGFPATRNPWDPARSAGGSSGGSAAAVASGAVAMAHGSDGTGSLRCPAALCGLVTLNPTSGRVASVPPAGQPADAVWRDFVLARQAQDLRFVFERLTGRSIAPSPAPWRVGFLDHDPELGLPVHPACRAAVHVAAGLLETLGHRVEPVWPPVLERFWQASYEAFGVVSDATRPPMIAWVGARLGRSVRPEELPAATFAAAARAASRSAAEVRQAAESLRSAARDLTRWWDDHDLLVTPATFEPPWPLGGTPGPRQVGTLLAPFSLSGQPSLAVPLHRSEEGLPIGVQIVGRAGADEALLVLAEQLEQVCRWNRSRPRR